jgi:hypothetical protein
MQQALGTRLATWEEELARYCSVVAAWIGGGFREVCSHVSEGDLDGS